MYVDILSIVREKMPMKYSMTHPVPEISPLSAKAAVDRPTARNSQCYRPSTARHLGWKVLKHSVLKLKRGD